MGLDLPVPEEYGSVCICSDRSAVVVDDLKLGIRPVS